MVKNKVAALILDFNTKSASFNNAKKMIIKNKSGIDSPETAYKLYASYYNGIEKK